MDSAREMWQRLNRDRYVCSTCHFKTYNLAHYRRHIQSSKHFLLTDLRHECPSDLKIIIASYLPVYKIYKLKGIGECALRLAWPPQLPLRFLRPSLPVERTASPPVQTAGGVAWTLGTSRTPIYVEESF